MTYVKSLQVKRTRWNIWSKVYALLYVREAEKCPAKFKNMLRIYPRLKKGKELNFGTGQKSWK